MSGMKLGLAINAKLKETADNKAIMQVFIDSVKGKGQFTVVEWSLLGKQLEIFGGNGKEHV